MERHPMFRIVSYYTVKRVISPTSSTESVQSLSQSQMLLLRKLANTNIRVGFQEIQIIQRIIEKEEQGWSIVHLDFKTYYKPTVMTLQALAQR